MPLGKRKRAVSDCTGEGATSATSATTPPLTAENLALLEDMTGTAKKTAVSRSSAGNSGASSSGGGRTGRGGGGGGGSGGAAQSGRRGSGSAGSSATGGGHHFRLTFFSINVQDGRQTWPQSLADLVDLLRNTPYEPASPNAKHVTQAGRVAPGMSEADGINVMERHLVGVDALSLSDVAMEKVRLCRNANLDRAYVPEPEDRVAKDILPPLEQPQPDTLLGYLNHEEATKMDLDPALTAQEELHSRSFRISAAAQYPFFTCQWKSPMNKGTHYQARLQSARDGAAIVQFLHHFYSYADDRDPDPVDTCHFSATCDMESVVVYVHWRNVTPEGVVRLEMQRVCEAFCWRQDQVADVRRFIRNLVAHAQGPRLVRVKAALAVLTAKYSQQSCSLLTLPQRAAATTAARSDSASAATAPMPPTPTNLPQSPDVPSHRPHKRVRAELDDDAVHLGAEVDQDVT
ncbi:hypothetical protein Slin15195_G130040 [Septoria linicola]|uniref:DUF7924 domain-containing protein n=1 Tax=Septoria linicola TaxID=215465 RepID=A0A9Q9ER14_9PEZI|nr:hypothetical protein Slin14017_G121930 [Septoria linicola]USW59685.1 hypothetical protein Slin15195_G130040 [Septoria linicola]